MRAGTLKDALKPADHAWFAERFQVAAVKRYGRLDAACSEEILAGAHFLLLLYAPCEGVFGRAAPQPQGPLPLLMRVWEWG